MSARILGLHYWKKVTYFLKTNISILTSIDRANDVNAADACMAPFLSATSTSSNNNYIRRCYCLKKCYCGDKDVVGSSGGYIYSGLVIDIFGWKLGSLYNMQLTCHFLVGAVFHRVQLRLVHTVVYAKIIIVLIDTTRVWSLMVKVSYLTFKFSWR